MEVKIFAICSLCEGETEIQIREKKEEVYEDLRDKGWFVNDSIMICDKCNKEGIPLKNENEI